MDRADYIISHGIEIFEDIFSKFPDRVITDLGSVDQIIKSLLSETDGLFIIDFLDHGSWDCLGSYQIDIEREVLTLNWHRYHYSNNIQSYIDATIHYKPEIISLMMHFKELRLEQIKSFPFLLLRGYAFKEKDALKYLSQFDRNVKLVKERKDNFFNLYRLDRGAYLEDCYCHDTPIYSVIIIPKNTGQSSKVSVKLLFLYNYANCEERLHNVKKRVLWMKYDEDELCEKANTIRRIFEFVLKIECCFHRELNTQTFSPTDPLGEVFKFKSSYSDLALSDLIRLVKIAKTEEEIIILNKVVRLSNELSHDSGKKVTKEKVMELVDITLNYTQVLVKLLMGKGIT